jgi:hypothetical protein
MVENINPIELRQTQSEKNLMISPTDKIKPSIIINKQQVTECPITPDKNKVNKHD